MQFACPGFSQTEIFVSKFVQLCPELCGHLRSSTSATSHLPLESIHQRSIASRSVTLAARFLRKAIDCLMYDMLFIRNKNNKIGTLPLTLFMRILRLTFLFVL